MYIVNVQMYIVNVQRAIVYQKLKKAHVLIEGIMVDHI